jgi:hypothetical protein
MVAPGVSGVCGGRSFATIGAAACAARLPPVPPVMVASRRSPRHAAAGAAALALSGLLAFAPAAAAKDLRPGDLRACAGSRCLPIRSQPVLNEISRFYYGPRLPVRASAPGRRARYVELRFRDGYVTGIAAGPRFDRFLSFGVNLDQFSARVWYAIPARAAREIRRLAVRLRPRRLPRNVLDRSH